MLLARSDDVDRLNQLAQERKWQDWLSGLEAVKPNRDKKRDAYRLHNLAVAHEAMAYESTDAEDWRARLGLASNLIAGAATENASEKYITEAANRIASSISAYSRLMELYASAGTSAARPSPAATTPPARAASGSRPPATPPAMSNQDVIDLRSAGLDDDNLIAAVKDAQAVSFDLSPAGLKTLLAGQVSNRVITAMRARSPKP